MSTSEPERSEAELDDLQREIDEVRDDVEGPPPTEERKFHERGTEGPVDDTIAPPG